MNLEQKLAERAKHAKRIQQKENHIKKQMKIRKSHGFPAEKDEHRYHKRSGTTCGDPNCVMCGNPRKFFKERTIQEKRNLQELDNVRAHHGNGTLVDEIEVYLRVRNGDECC